MSEQPGTSASPRDQAPPVPVLGAEFNRLTRRQSIVAWTLGAIVGIGLAAAAIIALLLG